jgi:stage V sporulation protein B
LLTLLPTVAHLKRTAFDHLQRTIREINRYTLLLLLPMVVLICVSADSLLPLLFGHSYQDGGNALRILIVGVALLILFRIFTTVLVGVTSPTQVTVMTVTMILLDIGLNLVLIPRYGITGAALASTLSSAFGFIFAVIQLKRHRLMLIDWPSAKRSACAALIAGALVIYHPANIMLLIQLAAASFVYIGLLFLFKEIQPRDRDRIQALLKRDRKPAPAVEAQA